MSRVLEMVGLVGALVVAMLATQVAAGWPLSPRLTGPALLGLSIVTAIGFTFAAGIAFASGDRPSTNTMLLATVSVALAAAGLWLGARDGLLALAAAGAAALVQPGIRRPARIAAAIAALSLALAAWRGPF